MDRQRAIKRLQGAYVTVPTIFREEDLELDLQALRSNIHFLVAAGLSDENAVFLSGGAAGEFSTMTFEERLKVGETIVEAAEGKVPVVFGAQTTSTRELVKLARAAERIGAEYIQVSTPFYFTHTEQDFYEYVKAAAEASDIGIIIYNTFWTASNVSLDMVHQLCEFPNVVGLKWATPRTDAMEFEQVITTFSGHLCVIDNQVQFASSHMMGARGFEAHPMCFWPAWGVRLWGLLQDGKYAEVQEETVRVAVPFYILWTEMERHTAGDGYLNKLCMELVGQRGGPPRPPTRDLREQFREKARQMLLKAGVPGVR